MSRAGFFSLREVTRWLGVTPLELLLHALALLVFTVLAVLSGDGHVSLTAGQLFLPLFAADGAATYLAVVAFVRHQAHYAYGPLRNAAVRLLWSLVCLLQLFTFKLLLIKRLRITRGEVVGGGEASGSEEATPMSFTEVSAPLLVWLMLIMVRACHVY